MKRFLLFAMILLMVPFFYSCSQEIEQTEPAATVNMQEITITASLSENSSTKTVVHHDNAGYHLFWEPGDKISLFYGSGTNGGQVFTSLNTDEQYVANFSGSINVVTLGGENSSLDDFNFWGVYPYRDDIVCDGNSITTTLPDVQTARAGSFNKELYITMGKSLGLNISFFCACSGIRFRVSHSGISQIVFSGNNGEFLAGRVKLGFDSDGKPKVMEVLDGKTSITLNAPNNGTFQPGTDYYIVTLPVQFSASMKMFFRKRDGNSAIRRWSTANIKFSRNVFKEYVNTSIDDAQYATFMETVDLGLPSGTLWATCNLGATSPEATGNFYAWGELTPRSGSYGSANSSISTKYQNSALTELEPADDAAYYLMGGDWRMPTEAQMQELKTKCLWRQDSENSVSGFRVTGPNGNSIFIPATGNIRSGTSITNTTQAFLYSSSKSDDTPKAYTMTIYPANNDAVSRDIIGSSSLGSGLSIRPVRPTTHISDHEFVELGDGLKWATCNIGADSPEEFGDYFAWGETAPKSDYTLDNYFDNNGRVYPAQYTKLQSQHDAAHVNWGGTWRMPTSSEWWSLIYDHTKFTWSWTNNYKGTGVKGMIVTSIIAGYVGNSIFLPAAGYRHGNEVEGGVGYAGLHGYYWSSNCKEGSDWLMGKDMYFYDISGYEGSLERNYGLSIRPVSD
jgi:hypothetical protein